jgi:hypothetical protein
VIFVGLFFNDAFLTLLTKIGCCKKEVDDEVDEGLGTYFQCLPLFSRMCWYIEEKHLNQNHKFTTLDHDAMDKLKNSKPPKNGR